MKYSFKKKLILSVVFLFSTVLISCEKSNNIEVNKQPPISNSKVIKWKQYKGMNGSPFMTEKDIKDLKSWGADMVRVAFASDPFMEFKPPYKMRSSAFENLERILDLCEKHDVSVLIDPHRFPGTEHKWTMLGSDPYWKEFKYHELTIQVWEEIAKRCKDRGKVIAGYGLLNEPFVPYPGKNDPADINLLYSNLIKSIRKYDTTHTILLMPPGFHPEKGSEIQKTYKESMAFMDAPIDSNLAYEIHFYSPFLFTHQGVWEGVEGIRPYPGTYEGEKWDKEKIKSELFVASEFSNKYNVPIFIGEFSCPRWVGENGVRWVRDVIDVSNSYGFSWAYHSFREHTLWDPEQSITDKDDDIIRYDSTGRKQVLLDAFKR